MAGEHQQPGPGHNGTHGAPTHAREAMKSDAEGRMAGTGHGAHPYRKLFAELALDFVIMFFVMYAMIASAEHLYFNIGNVYMTLMMVAPMLALMIVFMGKMYPSPKANMMLIGLAAFIFAAGWFGMREQLGVGDTQFLRSMIPHHSGAILMCEKAKLSDPETVRLCQNIIAAQEREIAQMQTILARVGR